MHLELLGVSTNQKEQFQIHKCLVMNHGQNVTKPLVSKFSWKERQHEDL